MTQRLKNRNSLSRICAEPGCKSGAQGKTNKCIAHGGGTRCVEPGCKASAQGKTDQTQMSLK